MIQPDRITAAALIASIDECSQAGCALEHTRVVVGTAPPVSQWHTAFRYDGETLTWWLRHESCAYPDRC